MMKNEEYNLENIVKILNEYKSVINYISKNKKMWEDIVIECDKAFGDIRHYCELNYPTDRKGKTKVVKLLKDTSLERRKYKDLLQTLEPLLESNYVEGKNVSEFSRVINAVDKKYKQEKTYTPRVLKELFE